MGNYKDNPKYNVVSIRVTVEEKLALEEMTRRIQPVARGNSAV